MIKHSKGLVGGRRVIFKNERNWKKQIRPPQHILLGAVCAQKVHFQKIILDKIQSRMNRTDGLYS